MAYTVCGTPTNLTILDNGDNTITLSCKIGSNGTDNTAKGVEFFVTFDGTAPSSTNYNLMYSVHGAAGATVSQQITSFATRDSTSTKRLLGDTYSSTFKVVARTTGSAGLKYYSTITAAKSAAYTWHSKNMPPILTKPTILGETAGIKNYQLLWEPGNAGINNGIKAYRISIFNVTTNKVVTVKEVAAYKSYVLDGSNFIAGNTYKFYLSAVGTAAGFDSLEAVSSPVAFVQIDDFPAVPINVQGGLTVPTTDISGEPTFIDIGSGKLLKLTWNTPTALNNELDYYKLKIVADTKTVFSGDIGNVNEFYLDSSLLSGVTKSKYFLTITLTACAKFAAFNSPESTTILRVCRGCGTYIEVSEGYPQPIMKRAAAFTKLDYKQLLDAEGKEILAEDDVTADDQGKKLYTTAAVTQSAETGWALMQEFYMKDSTDTWQSSDIRYEVLTDASGAIITDSNDEPIYVL